MHVGQKVMLICNSPDYVDGFKWPPIGAIGYILTEEDEYMEYDVMFVEYPCPVSLPDESWVVYKTWLIPINDNKEAIEKHKAKLL